jgi:hypothetical protein
MKFSTGTTAAATTADLGFALHAAILAALGLIGKTSFRVTSLIFCGVDELLIAVYTDNTFVFEGHSEIPLN